MRVSLNTAIEPNASAISAETSARTTADGLQNTAIEQMLQLFQQKLQQEQMEMLLMASNFMRHQLEQLQMVFQNTAIEPKCFDFSRNYLKRTDGSAANAALISCIQLRTTADGLQNTAIEPKCFSDFHGNYSKNRWGCC
jgi:hypothetical protein